MEEDEEGREEILPHAAVELALELEQEREEAVERLRPSPFPCTEAVRCPLLLSCT